MQNTELNQKLAPIALFVYNRLDHTKKTIDALKLNELAGNSELFIFSDAPKSDSQTEAVNAVREYVYQIDGFKKVSIILREQNFGLARSIVDGVSVLCAENGNVIVLEDDIVTSPVFLQYMNEALEKYKDVERVMHISGYMFPVEREQLQPTFFLRTASCWGWATWARAWQHFEKNPEKLINEFTQSSITRFNMDGAYDFWSQVLLNQSKQINTWAIFWYATVFQRRGLCLHPSVSLVSNIGIDGTGANCGNLTSFDTHISKLPVTSFEDVLSENLFALKVTRKFLMQFKQSRFEVTVMKFKKILRKFAKCFSLK